MCNMLPQNLLSLKDLKTRNLKFKMHFEVFFFLVKNLFFQSDLRCL